MRKLFVAVFIAACLSGVAQAQKINLGKMAGAASKGVSALTFTNEDAAKLAK